MNENTLAKVRALVLEKKWAELKNMLSAWPAPEVADILPLLDGSDRVLLLRLLPQKQSAEVSAHLDSDLLNWILLDLTDEETRRLLEELRPDDRTSVLEELPGTLTQRLLNLLPPEDLAEARNLLGYPEESIGRLMTPDYVAIRPEWTVARALEHVRQKGRDSETISIVYVVDAGWKLLDSIEIERLILHSPQECVKHVMDHSYVSLLAYDDREHAVRVMQRYDLFALPVVDSDGVLLGIVTADDVLDVAQEEATEDFHKSAAVAPLRTSYRHTSIWSLYTKRIGWLGVLVLLNLVSSGIIASYEETLAGSLALAFFIPLLIDSGGNAGSQAATLMVRALATGDLNLHQLLRTALKEVAVGLSLGLSMGIASSAVGVIRGGPQIGIIVGSSMALIVLMANIVGTSLPFVLTRSGLDPAVASSPLITTITDAVGLLIYFSLASWLLAS